MFAVVTDQLTGEVRNEAPWSMIFSGGFLLVRESREELEQDLERGRISLERRGMKVSRTKTEYLCANEQEVRFSTVTMGGAEVPKVKEFKYIGPTVQADGGCTRDLKKRVQADGGCTRDLKKRVQADGGCTRDLKKRVQAGWNAWRKMSGLLATESTSKNEGKIH